MESGIELLTGTARKLAVTLTDESSDAPAWFQAGLRDVASDCLGSLEAVENARGTLATVAQDGDISDSLKAARLADGLKMAQAAADSYIATATAALGNLKLRFDKELMPARPEGVTEAAVFDRKSDLAAILDKQTTPDRVETTAVELAKTALAEGDALTFYVLAGGPMRWAFRRYGVNPATLAERFAAISPSPVAKLSPRFKGANSIPALVTMTINAVDMVTKDLERHYRPMLANLQARAAKAPALK